MVANVWEPAINKINSYTAATEAACVILSIDETVRNPQSEQPGAASNGLTQQQQVRPRFSMNQYFSFTSMSTSRLKRCNALWAEKAARACRV
jgi:hypothetical protein